MPGYDDLLGRLQAAVPEFKADQTDLDDGLAFAVMGDLLNFVLVLDPSKNSEVIRRIFNFLEGLCDSGDGETEALARDVADALSVRYELPDFKEFVGKRLRRYIKSSPMGAVLLDS